MQNLNKTCVLLHENVSCENGKFIPININNYTFIFISKMHYGVYDVSSEIPSLIPSAYRGAIRIRMVSNAVDQSLQYQTIGFDIRDDGFYCNTSDASDRVWIYGIK